MSIKQPSGESSQSPPSSQSPLPPSQSGNMAWIAAAAAILVGGGVYLVSRSKGKSDSSHGTTKAYVAPKKRKFSHEQRINMEISKGPTLSSH